MLKLYTDDSKFDIDKILYSNDAVFDAHTCWMNLDKSDQDLMQKYDKASIIDDNKMFGASIQTPYGITRVTELSTGLKTLLNLRHMKKMSQYVAIDVTEAGENVLLDIFEEAVKSGISVILRHTDIPDFRPLSIMVDDIEVVNDVDRLKQIMWLKE